MTTPTKTGSIRWVDESLKPARPEAGNYGSAEILLVQFWVTYVCSTDSSVRKSITIEARSHEDLLKNHRTLADCPIHKTSDHGMTIDENSVHT